MLIALNPLELCGDMGGLCSSVRKLSPMWLVYTAPDVLSSDQCLYVHAPHLDFSSLLALQ
jgi:hypothetical protein